MNIFNFGEEVKVNESTNASKENDKEKNDQTPHKYGRMETFMITFQSSIVPHYSIITPSKMFEVCFEVFDI